MVAAASMLSVASPHTRKHFGGNEYCYLKEILFLTV